MSGYPRLLSVLAAASCLAMPAALAADGTWKFDTDNQDHPHLVYSENNETIFSLGCGHAFVVRAVYPGAPKKDEAKATITIANAKTRMKLAGEIEDGFTDEFPPNSTHIVQWDLGFKRRDPALYGKRWRKLEYRLFDFLDSGHPLTVSAEGRSYVLPAVNAADWKQRFKKIC